MATDIQPYFLALITVYALTGVACALAGARAGAALGDLVLLLVLWPLSGPFLLVGGASAAAGLGRGRERDLERALRRVAGTPLERLLPDRVAVRALGGALRAAALRVREIDEILARPGMSSEAAQAQVLALDPSGSQEARAALSRRLQSIGQLEEMRERFARRLAEVDALLAQLLTQVEVLRLGGASDAPGEELVGELMGRVEALGEMLEDGRRAAALPAP
jgi:uncharacterized protein YhaN